jgi:uncharacterized protein YbjT (DUF2867 family)
VRRILVIGATGRAGRQVATQLLAAGAGVRAFVRNPDAAGLPPEIDIVRGDLTSPASLEPALNGMDAAFLVWCAPAAFAAPALERITRRVSRVVYLSAPIRTPHPFFQRPQPNAGAALHAHIEALIENAGVQWTFLRPGMFAANALHFWAPQIRTGDVVRWPYLDAPTAPIDERDIAAVAVRALCEEGHAGKDYVLTGPESLTQREQIETIGRAIGRGLRIEEITADEARDGVFASWPAPVRNMLLDAWAGAVGQPAWVTSAVADITGAPARTFAQWAADHAGAFSHDRVP